MNCQVAFMVINACVKLESHIFFYVTSRVDVSGLIHENFLHIHKITSLVS